MATDIINVAEFAGGGFACAQFVLSTFGRPYGTLPAAGSGAGMTILSGASTANITMPPAEILQISGDDKAIATLQFPGVANPTFDLTFSKFLGGFHDATQGTTFLDAQSIYNFYILGPNNRAFPDIFLLLTQRSYSTFAGKQGNGYTNMLFPLCTVSPTTLPQLQTGPNAATFGFSVTVNPVSIFPWGTVLATGTHGTDGAAGFLFWSREIPTFDVFRQNNVLATYTPTQDLNANNQVIAFDSAALGAGATLAVTPDAGDFDFTAQASGNVTTFLYEVA